MVNELPRQSLCGVEPAAQSTGMVLLLASLADVMFSLGCWYFFFLDLVFSSGFFLYERDLNQLKCVD